MLTRAIWALASLAAGAAPADAVREVGATCVVTVTSPQPASRTREHVPTFSATAIVSLSLETLIRRGDGHGTLFLKVINPRGNLYQTLTLPYVARAASGAAPSAAPGSEQIALPVVSGRVVRYRVEARLPVAGTTIMTDALYGQWRAEPWLAGGTSACGPGTAFIIED